MAHGAYEGSGDIGGKSMSLSAFVISISPGIGGVVSPPMEAWLFLLSGARNLAPPLPPPSNRCVFLCLFPNSPLSVIPGADCLKSRFVL